MALIRSIVGEDRYRTWFSNTRPLSYSDGQLEVHLPSQFCVDQYESTFYEVIRFALNKAFGEKVSVGYVFNVISNDNASQVKIQSQVRSQVVNSKIARQIEKSADSHDAQKFDSQLNEKLTFENYCKGKSNLLACTIAEHIADHPEKPDFNPFFLYGSVGVGKTHLIQAIGIRLKEKNPLAKVLFITMRQFQNLYQIAHQTGKIPQFINYYMGMDAILFDDLQELTGKKGTAEALFPIFNHLHQHNKKLVFTCDRPPMELDGITDRLIDRFKWGITEPLPSPDLELRKKILHFKAAHNGLDLPEDVINLIAESVTKSVRELEGIVMGLFTRSISHNAAPITLELAREVISHSVKEPVKPTINFDMIVENTAEFYGLNPDAIFSKSRLRDIADARQMIMYLCSKHTNLSTPAIGAKLNREHSTVIHGIAAVKDRISTSRDTAQALEQIESVLLR